MIRSKSAPGVIVCPVVGSQDFDYFNVLGDVTLNQFPNASGREMVASWTKKLEISFG